MKINWSLLSQLICKFQAAYLPYLAEYCFLCRKNVKSRSMKYLIVSDIHGSLPALQQVLEYYKCEACDMLCLLGDVLNYGPRNGLPEGLDPQGVAAALNAMSDQVVALRGNCDSEVDQMLLRFPILSDYVLLVDEGRRLFLTHGHVYHEDRLPALGIDAFFYGHTHLQHITPPADGRPLIVNTGSPTFPKKGNPPTFAISENGCVSIHRLTGEKIAEYRL